MLKSVNFLFWLLVTVLLSRLVTMAIVPILDTTEARYGEVARIMAETGDWITPWFDYGVPFWGKPPLSFWLQAISLKLFGVTEFAARFPSWLASTGTLALIYLLTVNLAGRRQALAAAVIFPTMALSYLMTGAVLTDPFLALGTTLSFVSIILALRQPGSNWGLWFFVGLIIGLLAKGPVTLVLVGGPLSLWVVWRRQWRDLYVSLPWVRGALLTALLTIPWYIAAELKTPGFLKYFIVGEHFLRFIDSGWSGDLYGNAHKEPFGTIWLFWIWSSFPWGPLAIMALIWQWFTTRQYNPASVIKLNDEQRLLLLAALFPSLFFTFAGNILWTYQLPALAPLAILIATRLPIFDPLTEHARFSAIIASIAIPLTAMSIGVYVYVHPDKYRTEKTLVAVYDKNKGDEATPLIYVGKPPFSALFYSRGHVKKMTLPELESMAKRHTDTIYWAAVPNKSINKVVRSLPGQIISEQRNRRFTLIQISTVPNGTEGHI